MEVGVDKENAAPGMEGCTDCQVLQKRIQALESSVINATEDSRQYHDEYVALKEEGKRLYHTYEIKCTRLKENREACAYLEERNAQLESELLDVIARRDELLEERQVQERLEEENQALFAQVQQLTQERLGTLESVSETRDSETITTLNQALYDAEMAAQLHQQERLQLENYLNQSNAENCRLKSAIAELQRRNSPSTDAECQTDSDPNREAATELEAAAENLNKELEIAKLQDSEKIPPFVLNIEINPTNKSSMSSELFDSDDIVSLSVEELLDRLHQLSISNELLRDEASGHRDEIRKLQETVNRYEQSCADKQRQTDKMATQMDQLREQVVLLDQQTSTLKQSRDEAERIVRENMESLQSEQAGKATLTFDERVQGMCIMAKEIKADLQNAHVNGEALKGKLQVAEAERLRMIAEIEELREAKKSHAMQLHKQQVAYKNIQEDLRRMYTKHKKDLAELEQKYHYEEYEARYERTAIRYAAMQRQCKIAVGVGERLQQMVQVFSALHAAVLKKGQQVHTLQSHLIAVRDTWMANLEKLRNRCLAAVAERKQAEEATMCVKEELKAALEEIEIRGRLLCDLEAQLRAQNGLVVARTCGMVVQDLVSKAVLQTQQKLLDEAIEGVRESESLETQLTEMAEREWDIVQAKADLEKAAAQVAADKQALDDDLRRVQGIQVNLESNQSELRRVKLAKEELAEFIEQERAINAEVMADYERRANAAEDALQECQERLKAFEDNTEVHDLRSQLEEAEAQISTTTQHYQRLLQAEADAKIALQDQLNDVSNLRDELRAEVNRLACVKQSSQSIQLDLEIANEKIASLTQEAERQRQSHSEELDQAEEKCQHAVAKLESMRKKMKLAQDDARAAEARNNDLLSELEEADNHSYRASQASSEAIARLQSERDSVRSNVEKMAAQLARAQGRYEAVESRYTQLQARVKHMEQTEEETKMRLQAKEVENRDLAANFEEVKKESQARQDRVQELQRDKEQLLTQTEVLCSYSDSGSAASGRSVEELERENTAQRQLLEKERDRLRQYLILYKDRGDKKLKSLNAELQRAHRRATAAIAAMEVCADGLMRHRQVLAECGLAGIVSKIQGVAAELRSLDS